MWSLSLWSKKGPFGWLMVTLHLFVYRICAVMSSQKKVKNSQARKRTSQGSNNYQTRLSAWKAQEDLSVSKSISKHGQNNSLEDYEHADDQAEDALQIALRYFEKGKTDCFPYVSPIPVKNILDFFFS